MAHNQGSYPEIEKIFRDEKCHCGTASSSDRMLGSTIRIPNKFPLRVDEEFLVSADADDPRRNKYAEGVK